MKYKDFILKVKEMRSCQKDFFKTRDRGIMERSKKIEREIDQAIAEYIENNYKEEKLELL